MLLAERFRDPPAHTGLLLLAVGVAGVRFTVATVVAAAEVHPFSVAVTLYVPDMEVVELLIIGFCVVDV